MGHVRACNGKIVSSCERKIMIEASNLSHTEYFRLNGQLSSERVEQLLDDSKIAIELDVREFAPYAQEASGQFPSEDFLHEIVSDLYYLAKRMRGETKKELLGIIESLEDALQCQANASDYGRGELSKIIQTIKR